MVLASRDTMRKYKQPGLLQVCSDGCDGEYSASEGDYWQAKNDEVFICHSCSAPMRLVVTQRTYIQPSEP